MTVTAMMREPSADDRADEFKPVVQSNAAQNEQFSGYNLMVEAYAAIWLVLMIWLLMLWRKQASLSARVVGLEAAIGRAELKMAAPKAKAPKPAAEPAEEPS